MDAVSDTDSVPEGRSSPNAIQVIARAADILRLVAREEGLTLADIAKRVGLPRSTIQRIIKALRDEDFVAPGAYNVGIVLGDGLRRLAAPRSVDVAEALRPLLEELAARVDDTVDLSTMIEREAVFVEHIAGTHRLAALSAVGERFPLHSTANGKALLACLSPADVGGILTYPLAANTGRTITDPDLLARELARVRETGVAFDIEEHTPGVCAIGTGFLDGTGVPYAISIPVPSVRFGEKRADLETQLIDWVRDAARLVGGTVPIGNPAAPVRGRRAG